MNAASIIKNLAERGFSVRVEGFKLWVTPAKDLTDADRENLTRFKPALLAALTNCPAYSEESGWPGVNGDHGWLPTPPVCQANDMLEKFACPVPPFCNNCPDKFVTCKEHDAVRPDLQWMVIADGRQQLRADCPECGKFVQWAPQDDYWLSIAPPSPSLIRARFTMQQQATQILVRQGKSPEQATHEIAGWPDDKLTELLTSEGGC